MNKSKIFIRSWCSMLGMLLLALSACNNMTPKAIPASEAAHSGRTFTAPTHAAIITLPPSAQPRHCEPTLDDEVSPSYKPNMPVRTVVGHGHVLRGVVLSSKDCRPITPAQLELWPEEGTLGHPDSSRATLFTDEAGRYRFECNQPDHIYMRISAPGYHTIGINSYHPDGQATGTLDIVLVPE